MNVDEIVKELREACTDNEYAPPMASNKMLTQAADLIESLQAQLAESQRRHKAAVEDMKHIANKISQCKGFLSGGEDRVQDLKLGRCDVCKGICYRDEPCKFEWRGPQEGLR